MGEIFMQSQGKMITLHALHWTPPQRVSQECTPERRTTENARHAATAWAALPASNVKTSHNPQLQALTWLRTSNLQGGNKIMQGK